MYCGERQRCGIAMLVPDGCTVALLHCCTPSLQMELAEDGDLHARLKKQRGRPLQEEVILNCEWYCRRCCLGAGDTAYWLAQPRRSRRRRW